MSPQTNPDADVSPRPQGSSEDLKRLLQAAWLPTLALFGSFMLLMLANALFVLWELLQRAPSLWGPGAQLMLHNLPAIFVVSAPLLLLWPAVFLLKRESALAQPQGFSGRRLLVLMLTLGLFVSALSLFVQEKIVPAANRATVEQIQNLMMEGSQQDLVFTPQKDIRQMSSAEAWAHLKQQGQAPPRDWLDFYNKFSLSFAALAFALWGLFIALLLERYGRYFWLKLITLGTVLPILGWYFVYTWAYQQGSAGHWPPVWASVFPLLTVGGLGAVGFGLLNHFRRDLSKT